MTNNYLPITNQQYLHYPTVKPPFPHSQKKVYSQRAGKLLHVKLTRLRDKVLIAGLSLFQGHYGLRPSTHTQLLNDRVGRCRNWGAPGLAAASADGTLPASLVLHVVLVVVVGVKVVQVRLGSVAGRRGIVLVWVCWGALVMASARLGRVELACWVALLGVSVDVQEATAADWTDWGTGGVVTVGCSRWAGLGGAGELAGGLGKEMI